MTSPLGAAQLEGCRASMAGHLWVTVHHPGAVPAPRHSLQWGGRRKLGEFTAGVSPQARNETRAVDRTSLQKPLIWQPCMVWLTSSEQASDCGYRLIPLTDTP